jgi:hypothetical protein
MKKTFVRISLALMMVAGSSTPIMAGRDPVPYFCPPGSISTTIQPVMKGGGDPLPPFCPPSYPNCD